jgi:YidC/Oxa1 family membrane protein insertase
MMGKSPEIIAQLYTLIPHGAGNIGNMKDLSIITYFSSHPEQLSQVSNLLKPEELLNMSFLGINLGAVPSWDPANYIASGTGIHSYLLLLIPVLSGFTSYISMKYSMKATPKAVGAEMQPSVQNNMALIAPIMSGVIAFTVPAGLGLYWIIGNIYQFLQQIFVDIFVLKRFGKNNCDKLNKKSSA